MALSADRAIVAAGGPGHLFDDNNCSRNKTGCVQVLELDSNSFLWTPKGPDLNGTGIGDALGRSVALSANGVTLAAAGAGWSNANGQDERWVQAFACNSGMDCWEQTESPRSVSCGIALRHHFGLRLTALDSKQDSDVVKDWGTWNLTIL